MFGSKDFGIDGRNTDLDAGCAGRAPGKVETQSIKNGTPLPMWHNIGPVAISNRGGAYVSRIEERPCPDCGTALLEFCASFEMIYGWSWPVNIKAEQNVERLLKGWGWYWTYTPPHLAKSTARGDRLC